MIHISGAVNAVLYSTNRNVRGLTLSLAGFSQPTVPVDDLFLQFNCVFLRNIHVTALNICKSHSNAYTQKQFIKLLIIYIDNRSKSFISGSGKRVK